MLQWAYTEDQGLIEVDLSAISAPFDSNQVMLGPWAKLFFERMYGPTPFPLVSKALSPFPHILPFSSFPLAVPEIYHLYPTQVQFLGWEGPWRREWLPTPVLLPGKFHGQSSLAGYSPWWGWKESDTTERPSISLFNSKGSTFLSSVSHSSHFSNLRRWLWEPLIYS